ncbi:MAG TPA: hypothetical protein VGV93_13735 [Acidimicrobiales bacterium]|nr:hypothetical protein [Acidimicrobiales bacterium]
MTALLGAAGCNGGEEALGPSGTVGTSPTTTPTTLRPIDPAVIPENPADINEAYVQAVVDALFAVDAQATKTFVETRRLEAEAIDVLGAIYVPEEVDREVNAWGQTFARGSETLLAGALSNEVRRVLSVAEDCIYVEVLRDYSETTTRPVTPGTLYLGLTPKQDGDDPTSLNPTPWMIFMDGLNPDGSQPENPCESR